MTTDENANLTKVRAEMLADLVLANEPRFRDSELGKSAAALAARSAGGGDQRRSVFWDSGLGQSAAAGGGDQRRSVAEVGCLYDQVEAFHFGPTSGHYWRW